MTTEVDTWLEEGPIPDDVLAFVDVAGDRARREPGEPWEVLPRSHPDVGWTDLTVPVWLWARWPIRVTAVAVPGEITLDRPRVPDEAVALIGIPSGNRWERDRSTGWTAEGDREIHWLRLGARRGLYGVLVAEGKVRVVMPPTRQPRTFPKLEADPGDLKAFRGKSGWIYRRTGMSPILGLPVYQRSDDDSFRHVAMALLQVWQAVDGPLDEIIEDEERSDGR